VWSTLDSNVFNYTKPFIYHMPVERVCGTSEKFKKPPGSVWLTSSMRGVFRFWIIFSVPLKALSEIRFGSQWFLPLETALC
jgi:hypothetical protein